MIWLLNLTTAFGGYLIEEVQECDYSVTPAVPGSITTCTDASGDPIGSLNSAYAVVLQVNDAQFLTTELSTGLDEAIDAWNFPGVFDWSVTRGSDVSIPSSDIMCSGSNEVYVATGAEIDFVCGPDAAMCVISQVDVTNPCDIVESDIWIRDPDNAVTTDVDFTSEAPSEHLDQPYLFSAGQVLTHELGHVLGLSHDMGWPNPGLPRRMDEHYPNGGNHGSFGATPIRLSSGDFEALARLRPDALLYEPSNPMMHKFYAVGDGNAIEAWTPATSSLDGQNWKAEPCRPLAWNPVFDMERPWAPVRLETHDLTAQSIEVEWFFMEPDPASTPQNVLPPPGTCGDNEDLRLGSEQHDGLVAGQVREVGDTEIFVIPSNGSVEIGAFYHVCAKLTAADNDQTDDDVVISEKLFKVTDPKPSNGDHVCECSTDDDCAVGLQCQPCPASWPYCSSSGNACY